MLMEMEGAAARIRREREMVWWGAMLPHLKAPVELHQFIGDPAVIEAERVRRFHSAWDKVDRALPRHGGH